MIKPHRGRHRNRRNDPHEVTMVTREEEEEKEEQGLDSQKQQQRYYPASRRRLHNSQLMVVITVILALFQIQMGMSRVLMSLNRKCISCPCSPTEPSHSHCSTTAVCPPVSQSPDNVFQRGNEGKRDLMKFQ